MEEYATTISTNMSIIYIALNEIKFVWDTNMRVHFELNCGVNIEQESCSTSPNSGDKFKNFTLFLLKIKFPL